MTLIFFFEQVALLLGESDSRGLTEHLLSGVGGFARVASDRRRIQPFQVKKKPIKSKVESQVSVHIFPISVSDLRPAGKRESSFRPSV